MGLAFDGSRLLVSCSDHNIITAVSPADGARLATYTVSGMTSIGAMAWDRGRKKLWACDGFGSGGRNVRLVDLSASAATPSFLSNGCVDGLAFDGTDDTLWSSGDVSPTVEHYRIDGTLLSSNEVSGKIGSCGSSGIAVGGKDLFLANNGCSQIYRVSKTFSTSVLFGTYPARLEDLECDDQTFRSQGKQVVWSKDAYDNILNAFELNAGDCGYGGGSVIPGVRAGQTFGGLLGAHRHVVRTTVSRGDPINSATGAFVDAQIDASVPSTGLALEVARSYTSADTTTGPLGQGWTHTYNVSLTQQANGDRLFRGEDGVQVLYSLQPDGSFAGPPGSLSTLVAVAGGHELYRHDQVRYLFDANGKLSSVKDRSQQGLTLGYDASGRLSTITDAASRVAVLDYAGSHVTKLTLPDGRFVTYGYTGDLLTSVTDLRAKTTTYR